jgi:hypothetical protein
MADRLARLNHDSVPSPLQGSGDPNRERIVIGTVSHFPKEKWFCIKTAESLKAFGCFYME